MNRYCKPYYLLPFLLMLFIVQFIPIQTVFAGDAENVLSQVNAERAAVGAPALRLSCILNDAARQHTQDMVSNSFFSHTGSDGTSPFDRMLAAGYPNVAMAENIASGYSSASAVMAGWMGSSGHRANILNAAFTEMGLHRIENVWTQTFGSGTTASCAGSSSGGQSADSDPDVAGPVSDDGRLNNFDASAPITVNCLTNGGVSVFTIDLKTSNGTEAFRVTSGQIGNALAQAKQSGQNVQIGSGRGASLWALTSNELQAQAPDLREPSTKTYKLILPANACGEPTTDANAAPLPNGNTTTPNATTNNTTTGGSRYVVATGDTLFSIARRSGLTVQQLATANGITDPTRIFVGQVLVIPAGGISITTPTTTITTQPLTTNTGGKTHVVQRGENLFRISLRYGISVNELARANGITNPARIFAGQILIIPGQ